MMLASLCRKRVSENMEKTNSTDYRDVTGFKIHMVLFWGWMNILKTYSSMTLQLKKHMIYSDTDILTDNALPQSVK